MGFKRRAVQVVNGTYFKPLVIARSRRLCRNPVDIAKPKRLEGGAARQFHDWIAALRSQ